LFEQAAALFAAPLTANGCDVAKQRETEREEGVGCLEVGLLLG